MFRTLKGLAVLALVAATAGTAQAQGIKFGLHGGAGMPTGTLGEGFGTGYQIGGELSFKPAVLPIGLRADVDFNSFGMKEGIEGSLRVISGSANAVYRMPMPAFAPYLLGGVGLYNAKLSMDDVDGEGSSEVGFQIGAGVELNLAGMATALEVKLVNVMTEGEASRYVPVTFRIMF